jgi:Fe2+ or Zn2+ uptake regulation protein
MKINMELPKAALVSKGLNPSYQRVRILAYLMERRDHPTVGMVYDTLSGEMPTLARATVYNTLNALVEKGLVIALTIKSEETRYDFKRETHHHFLCKQCGSILDIEVRCAYADAAEVGEGHRVEEIHGYFKGTCKNCLRQESDSRWKKRTRHTTTKKGGRNG